MADLTTSANTDSFLAAADNAAARTALGLGTAATTAATAYEVPLTISTGLTRTVNTITSNFNPVSPGPIGGTTPGAGAFSTLDVGGGDFTVAADGALNIGAGNFTVDASGAAIASSFSTTNQVAGGTLYSSGGAFQVDSNGIVTMAGPGVGLNIGGGAFTVDGSGNSTCTSILSNGLITSTNGVTAATDITSSGGDIISTVGGFYGAGTGIVFPNSDPHVAGAGYWTAGVLTKSAG